MVQGLMKTDIYETLDKGQGDGNQPEPKNIKNVRERRKLKWKLFLSSAILLSSIFVLTGTVIYLNFKPGNCRKGCITVHIIPYMRSSLNRMTFPKDCNENDMDDSFDYIVNELEKDERRRFTIAEVYPLWKWWTKQADSVKMSVRSLINEGRIEIAGGGWSIPDEALVHYRSFIDQFTLGFRRLEQIAGRRISPDVSFLVDNRGHSKEIASLLREMDFRGVMLGGISQVEQCYRRTYLKMEFLWSDGDVFGVTHEKPNLFTSILDDRALDLNEYFIYEKPVIDFNKFVAAVMCQSRGYASNQVFIPIGGSFQFKKMKNAFDVMESLMNLTRHDKNLKLNIVYSTPSSYLNSVDYTKERWRRSNGEFLPYVHGKFDSWTGYYSLTPSFRYYQRVAERFLQVLKEIITLSNSAKQLDNALNSLRESVALSQHHHGATSLFARSIHEYFQRLLTRSIEEAEENINQVLGKLTVKGNLNSSLRYESCLKLNVSECSVTENSTAFVVTVYNPSHRALNQYVRVPVTGDGYLVRTSDGQPLTTQIVNTPKQMQTMPGKESKSRKELVFRATKIPALGFKSYHVAAMNQTVNKTGNDQKKKISLVFNESTGEVSAILRNGHIFPMSQEIKVYTSWMSNNVVFRPRNAAERISDRVSIQLVNDGELLTEYVQSFGSWASQTIRIYKDEDFIEYNWIVGPVPVSFFEAKEVVTSFTTDIRNGDSFYADSNGRGLEQKLKKPETENENIGERIAKNYRAVNSRIAIADGDYQIHVFNDRVQGGSSPFQGQLEIMLHRNVMNLAALGKIGNANDGSKEMESGQHWVFIGSSKDATLKSSLESFSFKVGWEPWYFFADSSHLSFEEWRDNHVTEFSGLKNQLPKNLRILTLEPWAEGEILLRLENIGQDGCDRLMINLQALFSTFTVTNATQVSLTGNGFKEMFNDESRFACNPPERHPRNKELNYLKILIYPSQIKTFILTVNPIR